MKYFLLLCSLFIGSLSFTSAQNGLQINHLFTENFRETHKATETVISGKKLRPYSLSIYHSISINYNTDDIANTIETLVRKDGAKAIDKEIIYREGKLVYGFYILQPHNAENRYIFFLNQKNKILVIYLEGKAIKEQIKQMINKK